MGDPRWSEPLNSASQRLAEELFRRFPEWKAFAEICQGEQDYDTEPGSLTVEVPALRMDRNHCLGISHRGDTFEVFYSDGAPPGPAEAQFIFAPGEERQAAVEAVQFMAEIIAEQVVIIRERMGGFPWFGPSTQLWFLQRDELTAKRKRRLVSVFSWQGTFDEALGPTKGAP